ncbi:MAG: polyprenyl synthetase family protein [Flavobacteriales bacterium]|jgi:geranylgeranyl diphosphate synthase type II|tara:strand:- start:672 stop:1637 length:966 start_codon:yes stop_codon:yes gene_type:complete
MTLNESREEVEKGINFFISNLSEQELYRPISYILELGGKRLRPALALLSSAFFGGKTEDILHPALAVEVFHNFSLMHDDIMDNAPIRRGQETVHEKWNTNSAILSGDAMLVQAYQLVINTKDSHIKPLNELFSQTAIEVCEGQQFDMDFETRDNVSIEEYIEMITLKTSVLIACALKMGAITAGASDNDAKLIYDYGLNMGIAFQLRDDYLDAFGQMEKVGKQKGGDILANKKTYLALKALSNANEIERAQLIELQKEPNPELKVEQTLRLFSSLEVDKDIELLSKSYFAKALTSLHSCKGNSKILEEFQTFSEGLMVREY